MTKEFGVYHVNEKSEAYQKMGWNVMRTDPTSK